MLSALVRVAMRVNGGKRLYLDDFLVLLSISSLAAATGIVYHYLDVLFLVQAIKTESIIPTQAEIMPILNIMKWNNIFVALIWTAIFAIKFAFLSFFHRLLLSMPKKVIWYYWFTVVFKLACWLFLVIDSCITCPYIGLAARKYPLPFATRQLIRVNIVNRCYRNFSNHKSLVAYIVAAVLDIVSDAMSKYRYLKESLY